MTTYEMKEICESINDLAEMVEGWTRESRAARRTQPRHVPGEMERFTYRGRIETKRAALSAGLGEGRFSGYASKFMEPHETSAWNLPMDWQDQVAPGAFNASLSAHRARGTQPAMLLQHEIGALPVGAWRSISEDSIGLRVEGELALATDAGRQVFELMKLGAMDGLSIGFKPTKVSIDQKSKVRTIQAVDLFEISPVTLPADPGARVQQVGE